MRRRNVLGFAALRALPPYGFREIMHLRGVGGGIRNETHLPCHWEHFKVLRQKYPEK
jgi:hypothetical protein